MTHSDVVVIGAGIMGAAVAYFATQAGASVTVVERGLPGSGTTSHCEGNILLSDKELGPELDLTLYSLGVWKNDLAHVAAAWEFEAKGGIIVASKESSLASLSRLTTAQRTRGVQAEEVDTERLMELEPWITDKALGAAYYPQDAQVQPVLAATGMLGLARQAGARVMVNSPVTAMIKHGDRVVGVRTPNGDVTADAVVNTSGTWAGGIAAMAGVNVPVRPRRGFVMVTEPLPPRIRRKVYAAEYVDNVGSSDAGLQSSPVVEGTPAGTILIGSTRERVGFDDRVAVDGLRTMAKNAVALFPFLAQTRIMRHYHGFRPYCPDHLPVMGHDDRAPGLWHACGHEGAGIGLSVGTGKLLAQAITGQTPDLDLTPFAPARFGEGAPEITLTENGEVTA
ncbi:MAG: NAD(P)/FAD-dependent oxidoreductase [Galactobacter sp.]